jgi:FkbM family methyltransferase
MVSNIYRWLKKMIRKTLNFIGLYLPSNVSGFGGKSPFVKDVFGYKLYQNIDDIAIDYSSLSGMKISDIGVKFRDGEMEFIARELQPGATVVDIGANVGLMTLLLAKVVGPTGSVFAFEPGPISFAILKLNTLINDYQNITLVNKAVSSVSGMETLFICPTGESDNQVSTTDLDWKDETRVAVPIEIVSMDDYLGVDNHRKIDFVKIDTQGGEYKVLKGMIDTLQRNQDIQLILEYAPFMPLWKDIKPQEFLGFIRTLGFKIYDLCKGHPELASDEYLFSTYPRHGEARAMTSLLLKR